MNESLLTIEAQPYPCSQSKMSLSREFWEQPGHLLTPPNLGVWCGLTLPCLTGSGHSPRIAWGLVGYVPMALIVVLI